MLLLLVLFYDFFFLIINITIIVFLRLLGRALLRNCKLLLLDEATSSIDRVTDTLVQRTIRNSFDGVTILTIGKYQLVFFTPPHTLLQEINFMFYVLLKIAHRVETIIDSDLIMVMDDGKVGEMDTPSILLSDENSQFSSIVKEMGDDVYKELCQIAMNGSSTTTTTTTTTEN
jgi:ABC-type multidrug transport system fused ATPase/permease subunit